MKAAVVTSFDQPPQFGDFQAPSAGPGESVVNVLAAPLSPIVRMLAAGKHYSSAGGPGFVAGVDGVGTDASGRRVYFLFPKAPFGAMAEQALVADAMTAAVPDALESEQAAAIANAHLAAWLAFSRRAPIEKGATVLVNGATGASGSAAVQVARYFGARSVIAVGRSKPKLARVEADVRIALGDDDADAAMHAQFDRGVDVVLDFTWGEPAARLLRAATGGPRPNGPRLRFVQIGTIAGAEIPLRGDVLRSSRIELLGSGLGSIPMTEFTIAARELLAAAPKAGFHASFERARLHDVTETWTKATDDRVLLIP